MYQSMAYTLGNKCAKNLCKRIVLLQLIIENVVTCFFLEHSVVWGHSRSLKMTPFDRSHMSSCSSSIVNMAVSCTVFEIKH